MEKKRRMVTKYVTEAFGLLLLTDSFNCTENLPVWMPPVLQSLPPTPGRTFPFTKLGNYDFFLFISKEDTKLRESKEEKRAIRGLK